MINANALQEFLPTTCIANGSSVTINTIYRNFAAYANKMDIPAEFYKSEVVSGSMFDKTKEDCMVISHPKHPTDYLKFCVRVKRLGKQAFVYISSYGSSAQMRQAAKAAAARKAGKLFRVAIANPAKFEEEQMYYQCIRQMCSHLEA